MAISGLAVTLSSQDALRDRALQALREHPAVTVGPQAGCRVAVVLETPTIQDDKDTFEALKRVPGVVHVDLISVFYEEAP